jgi:mono/diheme cytochrome c family protein
MRRLAALALLLLALGVVLAGCGGEEEATPTPTTVVGGTTEATTTEETTEATTEETGGGGAAEGDPAAGKTVFASAGCVGCHTLADANASGTIGPNLDDAKPDHDLVVERVTNGMGAMPSFKGQLSEQDIQNVAAYVVQATSG